jgi:hypothetical protein
VDELASDSVADLQTNEMGATTLAR